MKKNFIDQCTSSAKEISFLFDSWLKKDEEHVVKNDFVCVKDEAFFNMVLPQALSEEEINKVMDDSCFNHDYQEKYERFEQVKKGNA